MAPRFIAAKYDFDVNQWKADAQPISHSISAEAQTEILTKDRYSLFMYAWKKWKQRPLTGGGLGVNIIEGHAHNLVLEAGACGGLIGVCLILIPLVFPLWRGRNFFARGWIALSLISGLMDCYFVFRWPAVILAVCVGLAGRDE